MHDGRDGQSSRRSHKVTRDRGVAEPCACNIVCWLMYTFMLYYDSNANFNQLVVSMYGQTEYLRMHITTLHADKKNKKLS